METDRNTSARHDIGQWLKAVYADVKDFVWTVVIYGGLFSAVIYISLLLFNWLISEIRASLGL